MQWKRNDGRKVSSYEFLKQDIQYEGLELKKKCVNCTKECTHFIQFSCSQVAIQTRRLSFPYLTSNIMCYSCKKYVCYLLCKNYSPLDLSIVPTCFRILVEHSRGTARGFSGGRKSRARDK